MVQIDSVSREEIIKELYRLKECNANNPTECPINYGTLIDLLRFVRNLPSTSDKN